MKYLIVGLGNPGSEYADTRHNVGFRVLDALVASCGESVSFRPLRLGDVATVRIKNKVLTLLKPSTFMNLSGKAVAYWMQKEKIPLSNVLIVVDDIAFAFGVLRLRGKGSDGGHNGLKDICAVLGTNAYSRLRVGVGGDFSRGRQVDYVLGRWGDDELALMSGVMDSSVVAVRDYVLVGLERAMNCVNTNKLRD